MQHHHDDIARKMQETTSQVSTLADQSRELASLWKLLGRSILMRLDFIRVLGADIKTSAEDLLSVLTPMSSMLSEVYCLLKHLQRPFEQHFTLEDATGRQLLIYMTNVPDWESFEFFLRHNFKGRKGERRVQDGRYVLQERSSHTELRRDSATWEYIFSSRQLVDMSLFCKEGNKGKKMWSCPWCRTISSSTSQREVQW